MSGLMALESSCAQNAGSEGSIENMYENGLDLSSPSPQSRAEVTPPYPPPVNSPARFPPPPNSGFPQNYHLNMAFFEGQPAPHHAFEHPVPERRAPYDYWPERSVSSVSGYGLNSSSKFVSHWPLPSPNFIDNPNYSTMSSEPLYPTLAPLTQCPRTFASRFSTSVQGYHSSVSPSATVPSTSSASVSSPHFSSSTKTARPHFSSRFSFNPHASAFYPGMYSHSSDGPSEDFSPYYEPSYVSHLATDFLSDSHQGVDSFHDASSRPVHSPETAPRPISSTAPSLFSGVHSFSGSSATFSYPIVAPQPVSSRTDYCGLTSSSDGSGVRESSCDFPAVSSLSFELPIPRASVFTPYDDTAAIPLSAQLKSPELEEDNMMERVLKESDTLLYHQHISPEEWRWNVYEAQYGALNVEGLVDLADFASRSYCSTYNYFQGVDRIGPSCVNEAVGGDSNSLFALDILERSKFQNQGGPSLKLAASAWAEMLATSSTGQSMMAPVASFPVTAPPLPMDVTFPVIGDLIEAPQSRRFLVKSPDDCCSSSGSVSVVKEANDVSAPGGPALNDHNDPYLSCIPVPSERGSFDYVENVSQREFNRMGIDWAKLEKSDAPDQSQDSTSGRPLTTPLFNTVPQVGTAHGSPAHGSSVTETSEVLLQKASASSAGLGLENITSGSSNPLFTQSLNVSQDTNAGTTRRVTPQAVGAESSEDDASVAGSLRDNMTTVDPSTAGPCHDVSSSRVEGQVPQSACQNVDSPRGSVLTGISPSLCQAHADPLHGYTPSRADEVAAKVLARFSLLSPTAVNTVQTVPHDSGIQLLTTSILNLTKVLLATHSSVLPQSDIAPIQESIQSSILGLSECLLLEQAKVKEQPLAGHCVGPSGLNDSAGQEQVPDHDWFEGLDLKCQGGAHCTSDRSHTNFSEDVSEEGRPRSKAAGTDEGPANVGDNRTCLEIKGPQKTMLLKENDDINKHFHVGSSAEVGRRDFTTASNHTTTFQLQRGEISDILDLLRQKDLVNLPALKKLLAAEEREEKLKVLIHDLREQLEFEKEESRGISFLYEKIMQEAALQTRKLQESLTSTTNKKLQGVSADTLSCLTLTNPPATLLRTAQPSAGGIPDHLECEEGMGERPKFLRKGILDEDSDISIGRSRQKEGCDRMEIGPTEVHRTSIELEYANLDGVEARLALLRGRLCRDTEEIPTDTDLFTPDSPGPSDWNGVKEGVDGPPSLGFQDEQLVTEGSPGLTSQMLKQSDVLFNMDAAWDKGYDYVGPQSEGMESPEGEEEETDSRTVPQAYNSALSTEARALIIRSRSRWAENDRSDSGDGNIAGEIDLTLQGDRGVSAFSEPQDGWFETIHGGSDTSFGILSSNDICKGQEAVARNSIPRPEKENDVECLLDLQGPGTEAVKNIVESQDSEEESGWEHVRLPGQISK